ncbi:MAG: ATP-dependent DNA helicase [Bacteroidetes bacterium GWE2_42_24]|nr:MAG: ATP-dependent DNA helicase [Bacteroidetes bacterium GWE2_42_24]
MKNILSELNDDQRLAVEALEGPVMVIAGAGSGKTRVLTYRVAHLLSGGADGFSILALTFTNKAAREMRERIVKLVGREAGNVWMGTFHSVFARVLRVEGPRLGYPSNFTIYDTDDSRRLIKSLVNELHLDPKLYSPSVVHGRISSAKSNLISATEYNQNAEYTGPDRQFNRPDLGRLYTLYQMRLFRSQAMDFDDLLFNMNVLLRDFPDVLHKYQQRFQYIMVDEYQDTNFAQYLIIKKLAAKNENICVVGDDAQSIYSFRGANIQNILNFRKDYPDYKLFKLEQNYRSTKVIVEAANSIIAQNKDQIKKTVWTSNEEGSKISVLRGANENDEGLLVARTIFEFKMQNQLPNGDFAILYRTNAQSRAMEEALRKINIPYRIYGGLSFYRRKEIKDIVAYFRLTVNNYDEDALRRIINYPTRGIGDTTMEKALVSAGENNKSLWDILAEPELYKLDLRSNALTQVRNFITMIRSFTVQVNRMNAYDLARQITMASGILRELKEDQTPEGVSRVENIDELLNAVRDFTESETTLTGVETEEGYVRTLDVFLQDIILLTDADEKEDENQPSDKVSLMTIHAAKGLEFPYVFIVGLEENLFPSFLSLNTRAELEEERRLFYVAITRAGKMATLSYAESRYKYGTPSWNEPSRFITEIDERFLNVPQKKKSQQVTMKSLHGFDSFEVKSRHAGELEFTPPDFHLRDKSKLKKIGPATMAAATPGTSASGSAADAEAILEGMIVEHERFGRGEVTSLDGAGANKKATVNFESVGPKQLLLKFAKLRIV